MQNFWDFSAWGSINLVAVLLISLLIANVIKRSIKFLRVSLIPTSVLGGMLLLIFAGIYDLITGDILFETAYFGKDGYATLETITYHTLALGFIASSFKTANGKLSKKRTVEIFNTGVTTVSTYLLQAVVGFGITMIAALVMKGFFEAAGVLLPFGYGQGTGQAMNYGNIYETEYGFVGGKSFGLTIAALGFLSASIGGVIHLNILKKRKKIKIYGEDESALNESQVQGSNEIPMQGSMDKMTVQVALVMGAYLLTFLFMFLLGKLLPGMKAVIYGFNFLLGVLSATLVKIAINTFKRMGAIKKEYINDFLMTRVSNFFFDIMVVAGIAAIRLGILQQYWGIMLVLGVVGLIITYFYNLWIAKVLFPEYQQEQFLMMYGMLTGTASTGIILLREIDGDFKTPAADNMVYQNFPAIVFGFPMMLLATLAPQKPMLTLIILTAFFVVMNIILFRSKIFKRRKLK
ncbi:MAG: hypothetical protein II372_04505 [Clostridia bacterium]|nr:hypothetical protein [Clostridia bacterium]MBQ2316540.1 hypothetical protein [Clostridia bacterium]